MRTADPKIDFQTDFNRWEHNAKEKPCWDGRNQFIATLIPPGASIIDVGAGAMTLEKYLVRDTDYTPLDAVRSSERTLIVDFNTYDIPQLDYIRDYAVCSGIMEYILPTHFFIETIRKWARNIILSYAISDLNPDATTARTGWVNNFSDQNLRVLFRQHGLNLKKTYRWEKQTIYLLDSSMAVHSIFSLSQGTTHRPDVASVYRYDPSNVGDVFCTPMRYFDFGSLRCLDILDFDKRTPDIPANIIVGGGGLLGNSTFNRCFEKLFAMRPQNVIGWGLGENSKIDIANGYVEKGKLNYPSFINRFSLLGVRDFGSEHPWVPCASCMHPLFSENWRIKNEVVVFEHKRVPIPIDFFPKMDNNTNDFSRVVRFLATARVVITNSYHAAYWSQLLGKAVLVFPFSTKFYYLKHKVTLCKPSDWKKYLERVEEQPPALQECIDANLTFWAKARSQLNFDKSHANESSAPITTQAKVPEYIQVVNSNIIEINVPLDEIQTDSLVKSLAPHSRVEITDSENPGFDHLKIRLFEHGHTGCNPQTKKQTWLGSIEQLPSCPSIPAGCVLPTVVNFFTINSGYADAAKNLENSCVKAGLPHLIAGVPSMGSWERNCAYKAEFILKKWHELKKPILWLDADAVVRRSPALLAGADADFAIHKVNRWQFASGTIFFNQTENAKRLLECWVRYCKNNPNVWDQVHLDAAWEEIASQYPLKTLWLPQSYTKIFDRAVLPGEDAQAVIEHFQASRELKKEVSSQPSAPAPRFPAEFVAARSVSRMVRQTPACTFQTVANKPTSPPQYTEEILSYLQGRRIAIVGNATPTYEFGEIIDSYDVVIRLNNFKLAGFEKLVGTKTDYRCTSCWKDIEHRNDYVEFSPFTADVAESANLDIFNKANQCSVRVAQTDIHKLLPTIPKPSTGCALVTLCSYLGLVVDLFAFDGFTTSHYWQEEPSFFTTHSQKEFEVIKQMPNVTLISSPATLQKSAMQPLKSAFHIKHGYESRPKPEYFNDSVTETTGYIWQPDVYTLTAILARRHGCSNIIDIGCGHAQKPSQIHPEFMVTGIDFGDNIRYCRETYNFGQWIEADIEQPLSISLPKQLLSRSIIVCSDVIEHLINPINLLESLKLLLNYVPAAILSTPERDLVRGTNHFGPPPNKAHIREWNISEFHELLNEQGFYVNFIGLTRSDTIKNEARTILAVLSNNNTSGLLEEGRTGDAVVIKGESVEFIKPPPLSPTKPVTSIAPAPSLPNLNLDIKGSHEFSYWAERKDQEGTLANRHYEYFYTTHFGLNYEFFSGKRLLDIGCGPRGSLEWADMTAERIGLDPLANEYQKLGADKHKMAYVAAPSEAIPFTDNYFDVVTSFNSLDHVENLDQTIDEIMRVVKPGGLFLLLTDVNHSPTPCEPIEFSWDVVDRFLPQFDLLEQRQYEKPQNEGLYKSIQNAIPYDHSITNNRYGILSAKFKKRDSGSSQNTNHKAFNHLQHGFDLLKERRFEEAQQEVNFYHDLIDYDAMNLTDNRTELDPKVSVVIVAYSIGQGLIQCLDSLAAKYNPPHEIIVVDNGGNEDIEAELMSRPILHIRVSFNVILAEGRNIGVHFARAPIISFIDDDALAAVSYLATIIDAFEKYDIHAFRGKVLPKTDDPNNENARHYDMGDIPFPADIDTEGNSAFLADTWRALGGQDPLLFGGEGLEISYRINKVFGDFKTIYWPSTVIYHDYAAIPGKMEAKHERHLLMRDYSEFKHSDLYNYHNRVAIYAKSESARKTGNDLIPLRNIAFKNRQLPETGGTPFVSICVPTYNRAEYLEDALRSALEQTYTHFEIIVVDDGSTDNTADIVKRIGSDKIRYILKEHSGGPATRNRCISEARADFIVWLDSDDLLFPRTLERYIKVLASSPSVDVLYGDLFVFKEDANIGDVWNWPNYFSEPEMLLSDLLVKNRIPNVCVFIRKSCYEKIGGYSETFPRAHDYEFWSRLSPVARFCHVKRIVGKYRQHEKSLSGSGGRNKYCYEANIAKTMLKRHDLRKLFPYFFTEEYPVEYSKANSWLLAAFLMLKWGDFTSAYEFSKLSVESSPLSTSKKLYWLLDGLQNPVSANDPGRSPYPGKDLDYDFRLLVESFVRDWSSGNLATCAAICKKMIGLQPESLETLLSMGYCIFNSDVPEGARTIFEFLLQNQTENIFNHMAERVTDHYQHETLY